MYIFVAGAVFRGLEICLGDLEMLVSWNCRGIWIGYVDIISRGSYRTSYASDSFFSWQAQYLCHKTSKNRISYWQADVKARSEL